MRLCLAAVAALVVFASHARAARATEHPPDLVATGECEAWVGTVSGNDPSVRVSARLCPAGGDAMKGQLQWSSLTSGYNVRDVEGRWLEAGKKLEMRDVRIADSHPNPGWMFCTVDKYELDRTTPDDLVGSYVSAACRDHARVTLHRVPKPPGPPPGASTTTGANTNSGGPTPSPPVPSPPVVTAAPSDAPGTRDPPAALGEDTASPTRERRSGCQCALAANAGESAPLAALAACACGIAFVRRLGVSRRVSRCARAARRGARSTRR